MGSLSVVKPFRFAYRGIEVKSFSVGDLIPDGDEACSVALEEKWAEPNLNGGPVEEEPVPEGELEEPKGSESEVLEQEPMKEKEVEEPNQAPRRGGLFKRHRLK